MTPIFLDYDLPPERIAQTACEPRDDARLLVVRPATAALEHRRFRDLPELLDPRDLLVLNDTRVLPARLLGKRRDTGGKWEGLYLKSGADGAWELMWHTRGRPRKGEWIDVQPGPLALEVLGQTPERTWWVKPGLPGTALELLGRFGQVPLPPYIRDGQASPEDVQRYQTVYAQAPGSVAAPTAGLHFTPRVFDALRQRGIAWTQVTLHVGPGTFRPIKTDDFTQHPMHCEWGTLPEEALRAIQECRARGGRVVAVGTTSTRVLETAARGGELQAWSGDTNLFIYPPYDFRVVGGLVTNFHLPRTTLLLLVAALAGSDLTARAYRTAIDEGYRFYSYGDAMLVL